MAGKVIPAGSIPPEEVVKDTGADPQQPTEFGGGKYETVEDFEKGHAALNEQYGKQSGEIGELRKQNQQLTETLLQNKLDAKVEVDEAAKAEPPTDYEQMLKDVADGYEKGDLSFEQALQKSNSITADMVQAQSQTQIQDVLSQAKSQFQETLTDRDNQEAVNVFHKDNPDFAEMQQSGAFDEVIAANPMFDDLTAYYFLNAQRAKEEGMAEQARIASGSDPVKKVLGKPGTSIQAANNNKPMGKAEMRESMLAAVG